MSRLALAFTALALLAGPGPAAALAGADERGTDVPVVGVPQAPAPSASARLAGVDERVASPALVHRDARDRAVTPGCLNAEHCRRGDVLPSPLALVRWTLSHATTTSLS